MSSDVDGASSSARLVVEGMSCGHCEKQVRGVLQAQAGVTSVSVDLAGGRAQARFDVDATSPAALAAAVTDAGYPARVEA